MEIFVTMKLSKFVNKFERIHISVRYTARVVVEARKILNTTLWGISDEFI